MYAQCLYCTAETKREDIVSSLLSHYLVWYIPVTSCAWLVLPLSDAWEKVIDTRRTANCLRVLESDQATQCFTVPSSCSPSFFIVGDILLVANDKQYHCHCLCHFWATSLKATGSVRQQSQEATWSVICYNCWFHKPLKCCYVRGPHASVWQLIWRNRSHWTSSLTARKIWGPHRNCLTRLKLKPGMVLKWELPKGWELLDPVSSRYWGQQRTSPLFELLNASTQRLDTCCIQTLRDKFPGFRFRASKKWSVGQKYGSNKSRGIKILWWKIQFLEPLPVLFCSKQVFASTPEINNVHNLHGVASISQTHLGETSQGLMYRNIYAFEASRVSQTCWNRRKDFSGQSAPNPWIAFEMGRKRIIGSVRKWCQRTKTHWSLDLLVGILPDSLCIARCAVVKWTMGWQAWDGLARIFVSAAGSSRLKMVNALAQWQGTVVLGNWNVSKN